MVALPLKGKNHKIILLNYKYYFVFELLLEWATPCKLLQTEAQQGFIHLMMENNFSRATLANLKEINCSEVLGCFSLSHNL